ncbi:NAD(P)H-dependent oxidoreductase [Clostridioides sp. ZZV15-6598]
MGKRILVLNGSPRTNGNTSVLIDSLKTYFRKSKDPWNVY